MSNPIVEKTVDGFSHKFSVCNKSDSTSVLNFKSIHASDLGSISNFCGEVITIEFSCFKYSGLEMFAKCSTLIKRFVVFKFGSDFFVCVW